MALPAILFEIQFDITYCCHEGCGVPIALPSAYAHDVGPSGSSKGRTFYCYNGHAQHFTGEPEAAKLKRQLERANSCLDMERRRVKLKEHQVRAFKGQVTRIRNRVGNGVCPCCNRTFQNLMAHMATKHPDFKDHEPHEKDTA